MRRGLTSSERTYAAEVFGDSIDFDAVLISRGSMLALFAATAIGNTINLRAEHFSGDTLSDAGLLVLVHELGHVWQFQTGGAGYAWSSVAAQSLSWLRNGSRRGAYDWRKAHQQGRPWRAWNAEQQAECMSDYNAAWRRIRNGSASREDAETAAAALTYVEYVRCRDLNLTGRKTKRTWPKIKRWPSAILPFRAWDRKHRRWR